MYEVSTAKPLTPKNRSYNPREWEVYNEGYYQAVVAALRAVKAAFTLWEGKTMGPHVLEMPTAATQATSHDSDAPWPVARTVRTALIVGGAIAVLFAIEVLVLLGVLIVNAVS